MIACTYLNHLDIVKLLVAANADVNAAADNGTTPLMYAAGAAKLDFVEYLLSTGAKPDVRDKKGRTALDHARKSRAISYGNMETSGTRIDKEAVIARLHAAISG
jgi:ankyrin repeat protein